MAIHGGFWRNRYSLEHLGHLCAALTAAGFATWSIEYRRVGDPGGGWPGTFHDVAAGAAYLFRHASGLDVDPQRIAVLGHSAGGHLASWLVNLARVPAGSAIWRPSLAFRGAVPLAGVLDLRLGWSEGLGNGAVEAFLGGPPVVYPERYAAASPLGLVPSPVPHLVVHGSDDDIVPVDQGERYVEAAIRHRADARLLRLDGADHFAVIDPESAAWPSIRDAILAMMARPAP
jgi:acetyl esterase/lipase